MRGQAWAARGQPIEEGDDVTVTAVDGSKIEATRAGG